jgi:hypothetical protein
MAATKVQANWTGVSHGSTSITRVTSVTIDQGGTLKSFSADGDHFPTVVCGLMAQPKGSVTGGDTGGMMSFANGTVGQFTATHKDAHQQVGGDVVYTLENCVVENVTTTGNHADFGHATLTFQAYSSDGTTNPLSFTRS